MPHCFPTSDNKLGQRDTQSGPEMHGIYLTAASKQAGWAYRRITFHIPSVYYDSDWDVTNVRSSSFSVLQPINTAELIMAKMGL